MGLCPWNCAAARRLLRGRDDLGIALQLHTGSPALAVRDTEAQPVKRLFQDYRVRWKIQEETQVFKLSESHAELAALKIS